MFEGESIEDGVTLRTYRFITPSGRKNVSMQVRLQGDKVELAAELIRKERDGQKAMKEAVLSKFLRDNPNRWWSPRKDEKVLKEQTYLTAVVNGDPLFDMPAEIGENCLKVLCNQLESLGFKLKDKQRRSNGELDEEILHYA